MTQSLPNPLDYSGFEEHNEPIGHRGPQPSALSDRERQVLGLLAAGCDIAQSASELGIGEATVKTHLANAVRKLGATNRAHAVALALRAGVIDR